MRRRGEDNPEFVEFVRAHSAALIGTAYLLTGDTFYAENLVRTALIRAYLRRVPFRDIATKLVVRRSIVAMMMSRWWALVWRRSQLVLEELEDRWVPQHAAADAAVRARLWDGLQHLPAVQRLLVVLQFHEGLTEAETAELTASTVGAVRARTEWALHALRGYGDIDRQPVGWRDALDAMVRPRAGTDDDPVASAGRLRDMLAERAGEIEVPTDWEEQTLRQARIVRRSRLTVPIAAVAAVGMMAVVAGLLAPGIGAPDKPAPTSTADAGWRPGELDQLPVGHPPNIPYAVGRTIWLAPGQTVELPSRYPEPGVFGLGGSRDGLLLVPFGIPERGTRALHVAKSGEVTALDTKVGQYAGHVISPDGRHAAWTTRSGTYDEPVFAKVADLRTGELIATRKLPPTMSAPTSELSVPKVQAFDGNEVLLVGTTSAGRQNYALWNPSAGTLDLQPTPARFETIWPSSIAADTLLATVEDGDGDRCLVNVAVSNPKHERWRLCGAEYVPYVSPDAGVIALRQTEQPAAGLHPSRWDHRPIRIEIRDLRSGEMVAQHRIDAPHASLWAPTWESTQALLVVVRDSTDQTLDVLRCPISNDDTCERVPIPVGQQATSIAANTSHWAP